MRMGSIIEKRSNAMLMHIMNTVARSPAENIEQRNNKVVQRNKKDDGHVITMPAIAK